MVDIRDLPILYAAPLVRLHGAEATRRDAPRQPPANRKRRRKESAEDARKDVNDHQLDEYI
jgi:hypothetical protein